MCLGISMCIRVSVYVCAFVSPAFREILKKRNMRNTAKCGLWTKCTGHSAFSLYGMCSFILLLRLEVVWLSCSQDWFISTKKLQYRWHFILQSFSSGWVDYCISYASSDSPLTTCETKIAILNIICMHFADIWLVICCISGRFSLLLTDYFANFSQGLENSAVRFVWCSCNSQQCFALIANLFWSSPWAHGVLHNGG